MVGSTARGRSVGGIRVGARSSALRGRARSVSKGVYVRRIGSRVGVYVVRRGRVRAVATATRSLAAQRKALRSAVRQVTAAKATQVRPTYLPGKAESEAAGKLQGRSLAGTSNTQLNSALVLLCTLQAQAY